MALSRQEANSRVKVGDQGIVLNGDYLPKTKGLVNPYNNPSFGLVTIGSMPNTRDGQRAFVRRWINPAEVVVDKPRVTGLKPYVLTRSILTLPDINQIAEDNHFPLAEELREVVTEPQIYAPMAQYAAEVVVERYAEETKLPGGNLILV